MLSTPSCFPSIFMVASSTSSDCLSAVFVMVAIAILKHYDQKQLEEERVFCLVNEGHQDRNWIRQEPGCRS